jgi:C-terminal processing protease CtpA/Prc
MFPVPDKDESVYEFKSITTGKRYTISIPWVVRTDNECMDGARQVMKQNNTGAPPPASFVEETVPPVKRATQYLNPIYYIEESFGRVQDYAKVQFQNTSDSMVLWTILEPKSHNVGIIYLPSFIPNNDDAKQVVFLIRDLLMNQLKDTNAILFDIRDNIGGNGDVSRLLPLLFGSNADSVKMRALVHPINDQIFLNSTFGTVEGEFVRNYKATKRGEVYSTPGAILESSLGIPQVYLKPVGVFVNGNSYSASEVFAAIMQDNGLATIYGEDEFSGAGYIHLM